MFTLAQGAHIKERDAGRMKKAENCLFLKLGVYVGSGKWPKMLLCKEITTINVCPTENTLFWICTYVYS